MNWTFHLSCDRIQTNDCIFNPIQRAPPLGVEYGIQLKRVTSPFRSPDVGPSFDILSITTPEVPLPVSTPINCGAKEVVAQVINFTICAVAWWQMWNLIVRYMKLNLFLFVFKSCDTHVNNAVGCTQVISRYYSSMVTILNFLGRKVEFYRFL